MKRAIYLGSAAVLALIAALLTLRAQHTVPVIVAARDLPAGTALASGDLQVARMHEDSVPSGALAATDQAVGRYVSWPLTAGEPIVARSLSVTRSGASAVGGLDIPSGFSAIAVPILPAAAVGGLLSPGDRVDIYATPAHSVDAAVIASGPSPPTTRLGHDVLVVQLRSDQGQALDQAPTGSSTVHGLNFGSGKLGSVVVAVPNADVPKYAAAINTEVIYLGLSVS